MHACMHSCMLRGEGLASTSCRRAVQGKGLRAGCTAAGRGLALGLSAGQDAACQVYSISATTYFDKN
jgi:hypothetical protein